MADRGGHGQRGGRGRGRGRGRGEGGGAERGGGGVGRGGGRGAGRGGNTARGVGSGDRGRGRGRGSSRITDEQKVEIIVAKRPTTIQVASESTDDIIIAPAIEEKHQHFARFVLSKKDFTGFDGQRQIRYFVYSCLVNLSNHHSFDTSGLLTDLASKAGRERLREIMVERMYINAGDERTKISFQYVILPLIGVLTRENVCQSAMTTESGLIYAEVYLNRQKFLQEGVLPCMEQLLHNGSLRDTNTQQSAELLRRDPTICQVPSLQCALLGIIRLVYHIVKRNQDAKIEMADMVDRLRQLAIRCIQLPADSERLKFLNDNLERETSRLEKMMGRVQESVVAILDDSVLSGVRPRERGSVGPNMVYLELNYDPPGEHSKEGRRHDNDFVSIADIKVLPTQQEITCQRPPFLPSNDVPGAPHFLAPGWRRQLDIHFRLYREDMMDPLRKGIMAFLSVLEKTDRNKEGNLLKQKELRKQIHDDNVSLNVYGNVAFLGMDTNARLGGSVKISFAQPPQLVGFTLKKREDFWEKSKRRLMQGALVCVACRADRSNRGEADAEWLNFRMALAVVTRRDYREMAKDAEVATIHVSLTDPRLYATMLRSAFQVKTGEQWFLVESMGGFFESYRPVLKALQSCVPETLPFGKYLAPTAEEQAAFEAGNSTVDPPLYARAPGFKFDLSVLLKGQPFQLDVKDPRSIASTIRELQANSILDDTQASALVETLCREVALISGPPGTGKTKIGVDLMRALLHNKKVMNCGPIVCVCYTNHALDQFLEHLLDEGIKDIVRIGSRSKSERLSDYNMESLARFQDKPFSVRKALREAYEEWDHVSAQITKLERDIRRDQPTWEQVRQLLMVENWDHYEEFEKGGSHNVDGEDGFQSASGGNRDKNLFERWANGTDIRETERWNRQLLKNFESQKQLALRGTKRDRGKEMANRNVFSALTDMIETRPAAEGTPIPLPPQEPTLQSIPRTDRHLTQLITGDLWTMSVRERQRLLAYWKTLIGESLMTDLSRKLAQIEAITRRKNDAHDEARRQIMCKASVIGMTTSGAAKAEALIKAVAPKIIICEEAGEVLESHILAALSASTQHLILIGDHLQLRPQIELYHLSSDSLKGQSYNLDRSLFERLVTAKVNPVPSSQLTIQRRMRPEISSLIRNTLYPTLEDGGRVQLYPNVAGMGSNLYFMDHLHPEDNKDQTGMQSFANDFEVQMVEALAHYLIKNGYSSSGDIAVLTPYLGQLSRLRERLKRSFVLMIDERDQDQLDEKEQLNLELGNEDGAEPTNEMTSAQRVSLQSQLTLRTIDNYQGEEAKIVIISLVRSDATIGFLKSPNRTNVLLSRAKHGMFILGNAGLMDQTRNGIWPQIIKELRAADRIGGGFPIVCRNHPHTTNIADSPETLKTVAPNGGCTIACGRNMPCGHTVGTMVLACGHLFENPRCWQKKNPSSITCRTKVVKKLPTCEHEQEMRCHQSPSNVDCTFRCSVLLECSHACSKACHQCQRSSTDKNSKKGERAAAQSVIKRIAHGKCQTKCGKNLNCGHACKATCHPNGDCPPCQQPCAVFCAHSKCDQPCDTPCAACCGQCAWECQHQGRCNMPCGAPCDRLPCNKRCGKLLPCGHQCPSVCGETCPAVKFCVECRDPETMATVVDLTMLQSLGEVDVNEDPLLVPSCGHALTMATLDGMTEMTEYYETRMDSSTGDFLFVAKKDLPNGVVSQITCHMCRTPIVNILRYGRRVKYSQLSMRLMKHETVQSRAMVAAQEKYNVAEIKVNEGRVKFLEVLSKVPAEARETTQTSMLGKFKSNTDLLPNSNFIGIANPYGIPKEHQEAWVKLLMPVQRSLSKFTEIHKKADQEPTKQLFDAAVSHLYRIKTQLAYDISTGQKSYQRPSSELTTADDVIGICILECGLPPDGHAGSSFANSLQERTNVLLLVLHQALAALEKPGIVASGWYWFVGDLIDCALVHAHLHKEAAWKGNLPRSEMQAGLRKLDLIYKKVKWLGRRPPQPSWDDADAKKRRLQLVDELTADFMKEEKAIDGSKHRGLVVEWTSKAAEIADRMALAVRVARGELDAPLTEAEKFEVFRAVQQTLGGSGHWYRCPNGHSYVIADCGMAMEESRCPECGARIGGGDHSLRTDNQRDDEFEGFHRRTRI
ncbi:hypothetical protein BGX28_000620 [Mortierella sp. GBA30]|nr:hypothetical protein BGX28_000620 [Mortierella sp. GBA30]